MNCLFVLDEEKKLMKSVGLPDTDCLNYLTPTPTAEYRSPEEPRADWQHSELNYCILQQY